MIGTILGNATAGAVTSSFNISGSGDGQLGVTPTLPAGNSGSLDTRTDVNTGVVTLSAGHTIVDGKVDVYWSGGMRYGMDATVATNDVTVDLGAGDNFPAQDSTVIVSQQVSVDFAVDGDNITIIFASAPTRASVDFQDSGTASLAHVELPANVIWHYSSDGNYTNPLTGNPIATVECSIGTTAAVVLKLSATYDSTV